MIDCVSVDFDGVLHSARSWQPSFDAIDTCKIDALHEAGYAVAVSTCNDVRAVAAELRARGYRVHADVAHRVAWWDDPDAVLVSGQKIAAVAYLDDRAVNWQYGDDPAGAVVAAHELASQVTS